MKETPELREALMKLNIIAQAACPSITSSAHALQHYSRHTPDHLLRNELNDLVENAQILQEAINVARPLLDRILPPNE